MGQAVSASAAPEVEGVKRAVPERVAAAGAPALSVFSLHGTTTIITGGGHGLGQTLSKGIAEAGGSVACLDLHATPGNDHGEWSEIVSIAASTGATATYQRCDIMDETAMNEAFQAIAQKARDAVRGVVACTRIQQMRPAASYPLQDFRRILETKYALTYLSCTWSADSRAPSQRDWRARDSQSGRRVVASAGDQRQSRAHCVNIRPCRHSVRCERKSRSSADPRRQWLALHGVRGIPGCCPPNVPLSCPGVICPFCTRLHALDSSLAITSGMGPCLWHSRQHDIPWRERPPSCTSWRTADCGLAVDSHGSNRSDPGSQSRRRAGVVPRCTARASWDSA